MKTRTVVITLEVETDLTLKELKNKAQWSEYLNDAVVKQVQVNVVKKDQ